MGEAGVEIADDVRRLATVLVDCGVEAGERVLISAENRPEWAIADLAIMAIGAIVVPAYTTNTEDDHHYIMDHSGASVAITSGGVLASRIALAANRAPSLRHLIVMDDKFVAPQDLRPELRYWGAAIEGADPLKTSNTASPRSSLTMSAVSFTPRERAVGQKGMLTHRSIQANIKAAIELLAEGLLSKISVSCLYCHYHIPMNTPPACTSRFRSWARSGIVKAPTRSRTI